MLQQSTVEDITPENVVRLIEKLSKKSVKTAYCYEKRKEQIKYQDKLKQHLLRRYNLAAFDQKVKKTES